MDYYGQNGAIPWNMQMPKVYDDGVEAVHGMEGAKAVQLKAGSSVILPDDCERYMYFISANQFGIKTVTRYPYGDPDACQPQTTQTQQADTPVYVTTDEFDSLKKEFGDVKATLNKLVEELK